MAGKFVVIGLGHFGTMLALDLTRKGSEVLCIDENLQRLEEIKDQVAHTVRLDSRDEKALRSQGLDQFDAVIVGIGDDFEATLLTVAMLQKIGIQRIIVRATTPVHEQILAHLGIQQIVLPARDAAVRLATNLTFEGVTDSFVLSPEFAIVEIKAPAEFVGQTLLELKLREVYELILITIKRTETRSGFMNLRSRTIESVVGIPQPETRIESGDVLILFGRQESISKILSQIK